MWVAQAQRLSRNFRPEFCGCGARGGPRLGGGSGCPCTSWKARITLRGTAGGKGFWVKEQLSQHQWAGICARPAPALEPSPRKPRPASPGCCSDSSLPCVSGPKITVESLASRSSGGHTGSVGPGAFGGCNTGHWESHHQRLDQHQGLPLSFGNCPASPRGASGPFLDSA